MDGLGELVGVLLALWVLGGLRLPTDGCTWLREHGCGQGLRVLPRRFGGLGDRVGARLAPPLPWIASFPAGGPGLVPLADGGLVLLDGWEAIRVLKAEQVKPVDREGAKLRLAREGRDGETWSCPSHTSARRRQALLASLAPLDAAGRRERLEREWAAALQPRRVRRQWLRFRRERFGLALLGTGSLLCWGALLPLLFLLPLDPPQRLAGVGFCLAVSALTAVTVAAAGGRLAPERGAGWVAEGISTALLPFHAMRAMDEVARESFAEADPLPLLLQGGESPRLASWLAPRWARLLHPRPGNAADLAVREFLRPRLEPLLQRAGTLDSARPAWPRWDPDEADREARCPRCLEFYTARIEGCRECDGLALVPLERE